jgi:hypothetical protein
VVGGDERREGGTVVVFDEGTEDGLHAVQVVEERQVGSIVPPTREGIQREAPHRPRRILTTTMPLSLFVC